MSAGWGHLCQTFPNAASVGGILSEVLESTDVTILAVGHTGQVPPLPHSAHHAPDLFNICFLSLWHVNLLLEEPDVASPSFGWCLELCQLNYEIIQSCQLDSWDKCTPCKLWTPSIVPWKCPYHQHAMNAPLWTNKCFIQAWKKLRLGCHVLWIVSPFWCWAFGKKWCFIHIFRVQKETTILQQSILVITVLYSIKTPPADAGKEVEKVMLCLEKHPKITVCHKMTLINF